MNPVRTECTTSGIPRGPKCTGEAGFYLQLIPPLLNRRLMRKPKVTIVSMGRGPISIQPHLRRHTSLKPIRLVLRSSHLLVVVLIRAGCLVTTMSLCFRMFLRQHTGQPLRDRFRDKDSEDMIRVHSHLQFIRGELLHELFSPCNPTKWVQIPLLNFSVHDQIASVNTSI